MVLRSPRIARPVVELHLLRHADAGDPLAWSGPDAARPLSQKGRRQAERLADFLVTVDVRPEAILSSPKLRALETAEIVAARLGLAVLRDDRLAGGVDLAAVETLLADHGDPARPALVGHDPDFSELLAVLLGPGSPPLRKGALARVDATRPLRSGSGTLRWLVPPELLKPAP